MIIISLKGEETDTTQSVLPVVILGSHGMSKGVY